jgi:hypothetical protein
MPHRGRSPAPLRRGLPALKITNEQPATSALSRHPEIMLGMLVAVLRLNDVAVDNRLAGEFQVALVVSVGVPRTVLTLPSRDVLNARRLPALRSPASISVVIHFLSSMIRRIRGFHRNGQTETLRFHVDEGHQAPFWKAEVGALRDFYSSIIERFARNPARLPRPQL